MATKYVDLLNGNDANNGSTFALRKKTLASAAAVATAGDIIRIMGRTVGASGINATFTNLSGTVILASALTVGLYTTGAAWTAVTNVTTTASQAGKLGATSVTHNVILRLANNLILPTKKIWPFVYEIRLMPTIGIAYSAKIIGGVW